MIFALFITFCLFISGKITAQGKLLHRGPLVALDNFDTKNKEKDTKPIMKPFTCFLFEQIMIFSETVGKKTQFTSPVYVYKAHFLVSYFRLLKIEFPYFFFEKFVKTLSETLFTSPFYIYKAHFLVRYLFSISVSVVQFQ